MPKIFNHLPPLIEMNLNLTEFSLYEVCVIKDLIFPSEMYQQIMFVFCKRSMPLLFFYPIQVLNLQG